MRREFPNYGKAAGLTVEDWWSSIINAVFEQAPLPSGAQSKLYQQFNCGTAYYLFPDAIPMLDHLASQVIPVAVLSNSDGRIRTVMDDLGLTQYMAKSPVTGKPSINLSYDLGVEKPDKKAFQLVRELMNIRDPTMCWYVGDDVDQDFHGALAAGWNAVLLDRTGLYTDIRDNLQDRGIKSGDGSVLVTSSPAKAYIDSLSQLKALLNNGF
jgi:FMN phosphatase YigB (HAD superfamily)